LFDRNGIFSSEVAMELEHLCVTVDALLNFLGVALGAQEVLLWDACHHVLNAIDSGVYRGVGVALAMAEVSVEADLTRVSGFPAREELCYYKDLVARYGPAREAVAAHVHAA
jgi:hypothetical protein